MCQQHKAEAQSDHPIPDASWIMGLHHSSSSPAVASY